MVGIDTEQEAHVVAVVGHVFDQDSWWQQAERAYYPSLHQGETWIPSYMWVPEFIVQDDNFGPYMSVPRTVLASSTRSVVIPVPLTCNMFLPGHKAESMAAGYLTGEFREYILNRTRVKRLWKNAFGSAQEQQRLVLRTVLITREILAKHIKEVKLSRRLLDTYNQTTLPPWVWLIEISTPELFSQQQKLGEIILNASYPAQHIRTGIEPLLSMRILDVTVVGTDFHNPIITLDSDPVRVLSRPTFSK
jgi:hypothetical protein